MAEKEASKWDAANKGIAGAMDNDNTYYEFHCNACGKGMDSPVIAAGGPVRFWCSWDCHLQTMAQ